MPKSDRLTERNESGGITVQNPVAALAKLAELEDAEQNGWISVKDRLPERGRRVLVAYDPMRGILEHSAPQVVCGALSRQYDDCWVIDNVFFGVEPEKVTHWRPFPAPPTAQDVWEMSGETKAVSQSP